MIAGIFALSFLSAILNTSSQAPVAEMTAGGAP